jgi:hypothetical protein
VLRGEMEHPHGYFMGIDSLTLYRAQDRYCATLVTVQWCRYFENMYNVMETREMTFCI